ncbi:MAG TPA: DUF6448 family protein [Kofleriaceae bacterium]|nr:DUF6448 family protein [Kofleriaceae bacterium]
MRSLLLALTFALVAASPRRASAHCDTMDGPVVQAGQKALDTGDLDFVLVWVKPAAETELRAAFKQATSVRKLSGEARELADRYFLETLVRLHRAGEGEPYTGIQPAGTDVGPAISAADTAIKTGSVKALNKLITDTATAGLKHRFDRVLATRKYKPHDIAAGREYVDAYVMYLHYAEGLYDTAATTGAGHGGEAAEHH